MMIARVGLLLLICLVASVNWADAIELAVPSDMYEYNITSSDLNSGAGFYHMDPTTWGSPNRGYSMIMDFSGKLVWFMKGPNDSGWMMNLQKFGDYYVTIWNHGLAEPFVYDAGWNLVDILPGTHPITGAALDLHEAIRNEDGNYWLEFMYWRTVDMSQIVPGGNPNAQVWFHVVELWDQDHNILWSWDSFEHQDGLPLTDIDDQGQLVQPSFEHLHLNSIHECENGDVLISSRQMSTIHRIDRTTGDVLWRLGGGLGNDFQFLRGEDIPESYPLNFFKQHDGRELGPNHYSVFDNGNHHPVHRAYGREYILDESLLTATLVWAWRRDPAENPSVQGSYQRTYDEHHLICWGHDGGVQMNATELDENNNVVFELDLLPDRVTQYNLPGIYRVRKYETFTAADAPYICTVKGSDLNPGQLFINWFGHEDEVEMYEIEVGTSPNNFNLWATINTGVWTISNLQRGLTYYVRARAMNLAGSVISPWSNVWQIQVGGNVVAFDAFQNRDWDSSGKGIYSSTAADETFNQSQPGEFGLINVYPNPFNASTTISVSLPQSADLSVVVFNVAGQQVAELANSSFNLGTHTFSFDAAGMASGLYFIRATIPDHLNQVQKVMLVR
jgi:Arylsulfotransferase (ASST)/Secretion system C-terminal sorting domain